MEFLLTPIKYDYAVPKYFIGIHHNARVFRNHHLRDSYQFFIYFLAEYQVMLCVHSCLTI